LSIIDNFFKKSSHHSKRKIIIQKAPLINNIKIAVLHYKLLVMPTEKYKENGHLSQDEREEISKMLYAGKSYREI
jgi:hypothetical protein